MILNENTLKWAVDKALALVHHQGEPRVSFAFDRDIHRPGDIRRAAALYVGLVISEIELSLLEQQARRALREALFGESFPPADSRRLEFRQPPRLAWSLPTPSTDGGLPL